eukprot:7076372-Alexandrium_andersonii.AAC.1
MPSDDGIPEVNRAWTGDVASDGPCGRTGALQYSRPYDRMASAKVQPTRSLSPCFHPTAFMPAATATTLANEMIHWSTLGGVGREKRAIGLVAPA